MDCSVMCASWLKMKFTHYHEIMEREMSDDGFGKSSMSMGFRQSDEPSPKNGNKEKGISARKRAENNVRVVRNIAEERTAELAEGVASVLGEEMQNLERRQLEQQQVMKDTQITLESVGQSISKLRQTCGEVAQMADRLAEQNVPASTMRRASNDPGARRRSANRDSPIHNHRFSQSVGGTRI